jgi:hypothetical protein
MGISAASISARLELDKSDFDRDIKSVEDQTGAASAKMAGSFNNVNPAANGTAAAVGNVKMAYTEFNSALMIANAGLDAAVSIYEGIITPAMEYAAQVRELSRLSGASAEDTSRLIQMADDMTISYDALKLASKGLAKDGISLTSESLAKLSDEYLALAPGAARADFLVKQFGRSGLEMGKLLDQGSTSIRGMSAAIDENMILTEEAVRQARAMEVATDDLDDAMFGMKLTLANEFIPTLALTVSSFTEALKGMDDTTTGWWQFFDVAKQVEFIIRMVGDAISKIPAIPDFFGNLFNQQSSWGYQAPSTKKAQTSIRGANMASGGSFIVPSGFPNDTFPINATSGEKVTVDKNGGNSAPFDYDRMALSFRDVLLQVQQ